MVDDRNMQNAKDYTRRSQGLHKKIRITHKEVKDYKQRQTFQAEFQIVGKAVWKI